MIDYKCSSFLLRKDDVSTTRGALVTIKTGGVLSPQKSRKMTVSIWRYAE